MIWKGGAGNGDKLLEAARECQVEAVEIDGSSLLCWVPRSQQGAQDTSINTPMSFHMGVDGRGLSEDCTFPVDQALSRWMLRFLPVWSGSQL